MSRADIEKAVNRILNGAQATYTEALADAMASLIREVIEAGWSVEDLQRMAEEWPGIAQAISSEHSPAVRAEAYSTVRDGLEQAGKDDLAALLAVTGAAAVVVGAGGKRQRRAQQKASSAALNAAEAKEQAATSRIRSRAEAAAQTVADALASQNLNMLASSARAWRDVAAQAANAHAGNEQPLQKLIADAVSLLGNSFKVRYDTGRRDSVDVALRRLLTTSFAQTQGTMTLDLMGEYGWDLVHTDAHFGARPSHAAWQGLPACVSGPRIIDGVSYPGLAELTGYGTVTGLHGVNCRHVIEAYFPGVTELPDREFKAEQEKYGCTSEEYYELSQSQRAFERAIRKTKYDVAFMEKCGLGLENPAYVQKRLVLGNQQRKLAAFCKETGMKRQYSREKAYGIRKQPRAKYEPDIEYPKSLSAAAFRDTVLLPDGSKTKTTEGTRITNIVVIAGKGANRKIDMVDWLVNTFGGKKSQWRKLRGTGYVDDMGMSRKCELHWYDEETVGRVQMKVKRFYY